MTEESRTRQDNVADDIAVLEAAGLISSFNQPCRSTSPDRLLFCPGRRTNHAMPLVVSPARSCISGIASRWTWDSPQSRARHSLTKGARQPTPDVRSESDKVISNQESIVRPGRPNGNGAPMQRTGKRWTVDGSRRKNWI